MSINPEEVPKPEQKPEEKTEFVWWHMLLIGLGFFVGAIVIYFYITNIEEQGGGRIHWLLAILYNWGGKWLCVGFVALFGFGFTAGGIAALVKKTSAGKDDEFEAEAGD